jgi:hypothetical protein
MQYPKSTCPDQDRRQFLQGLGVSMASTVSATLPLLSCGGGGDDKLDRPTEQPSSSSGPSILSMGGDHPYSQWYGSTGRDGLFSMYEDLKISPYIAICADESPDRTSGHGATLGKPSMMTAAQAKSLQARGAEFVSHGGRHQHFWDLLNTGIRVSYTGSEATPTVNISTTELVTTSSATGASSFPFATHTSLAALAAAINALPGWACLLATELTGDEPSAALMPLQAPRSVANNHANDLTDSNQRFAVCGGIMLRYTGRAYRDVCVSVNEASDVLELYADGALVLVQTTATTLSAMVAGINARNIAGLTALVMDNGFAAQADAGSYALNPGQKLRETYCLGDELGTSLQRTTQAQSVNFTGLQICGGVGFAYALRRCAVSVKERAARLYGLRISSFAQSGGRLYSWHVHQAAIAADFVQWRGNRSCPGNYSGISPHAMPLNTPGAFVGHFTSISPSSPKLPYLEPDVMAVVDALADEGGWYVNWLNHLCTPTPSDPSPYAGVNQHTDNFYAENADQDEGPFYRELLHAASLRDAGKLQILAPTQAQQVRHLRKGPSNLVFNPRFRNGRLGNLVGVSTLATGMTGVACPGWNVQIAASDFSVAAVDAEGALTLTTRVALASNKTPLGLNLFLEPGKTYDIGASLNLSGWDSKNGVSWIMEPLENGMGRMASRTFDSGHAGEAPWWRTSVANHAASSPAYVRSIAGPFAFTDGEALTLQLDGQAASAAIALTGLTTAQAVADAINAALKRDAAYAVLPQYHTTARAENNKLVIELPQAGASADPKSSLILLNNAVGSPLATLFDAGVTAVRATGQVHTELEGMLTGYRLYLLLPAATPAQQTIKISAPYCREVGYVPPNPAAARQPPEGVKSSWERPGD